MPTDKKEERLAYCFQCQKHTKYIDHPASYATICTVCGSHASTLMRLQAQQTSVGASLVAPDGAKAEVVDNNPDKVTFFIPHGEHRGYYSHDKHTGKNEIRQI